jgi:hypothetical protein
MIILLEHPPELIIQKADRRHRPERPILDRDTSHTIDYQRTNRIFVFSST